MSLPEKPFGNNPDDIWHFHESEVRLLYQTKSLNEVKRMMDTKPGFPKMAIKTWHEKLGNHGIRKNVKNQEWSKVYRYCARYRLEDPSRKQGDKRLKRTKRKTEVILGNRTFTWDQAWKNMKRAGAIVEPQLDPPSPLPIGITVRTPPLVPSSPSPHISLNTLRPRDESTNTIQSQGPVLSSDRGIIPKGNTYLGGGRLSIQQSRLLEPSPKSPLSSNGPSLSDTLNTQMMFQLPGLPVWALSNALIDIADLDLPSRKSASETWYGATVSLTPHPMSPVAPTFLSGDGISNESVFHLSDLLSSLIIREPSAALTTFGTGGRAYITISVAIYLLSNNLFNPNFGIELPFHRELFETLDSVFAEIPARHLQALLQSRLDSVRGAFEALLNISGLLQQRYAFKSLLNIGTDNNWLAISAHGHEYLYHAVCMDLDEVVQQLLKSGCRPDRPVWLGTLPTATTSIVKALERRNIQCVQLLLKHCDVNRHFQFEPYSTTSFSFFIQKTWYLDEFEQGIRLFLDAGADFNSLLKRDTGIFTDNTPVRPRWQENRIWSVLDYLFCFHPHLFYKVTPNWSPAHDSQPTRAGVLMSLQFGSNTLSEYCIRLAQIVGWACLYEYLELLVAEQIVGIGPWMRHPSSVTDLKTVCALVKFGVSMGKVLSRAPCLLSDFMKDGRREGYRDCDMEVIRYLLDNRAIVDDQALSCAVRWRETDLLALLIQSTTDMGQRGAAAVVQAATANNFEAVKILLDAGVDVNTDFVRNPRLFGSWMASRRHETASLLCQIIEMWSLSFENLSNMIDFLVQRGAHFRLSASKPLLSDLMESVLGFHVEGYKSKRLLERIVQYIIDAGCDLSDPHVPSARLLEVCCRGGISLGYGGLERMEIFESVLRNGALLRPGAPLAAWISIGGGVELVSEMLCGDIDIDAYYHGLGTVRTALQVAAEKCSEKLVVLLLQKGANVNAPARGREGKTALQAICDNNPWSPAEKAQQMSIINLLLAYGAKINAAPARRQGWTALQFAAMTGSLEVTMLLLSYDLPADVNMPPCQFNDGSEPHGNALDVAAECGRIDVVKLLLNIDALSSFPGDTGYDGAIEAAEDRGKLAVADMIRQHATDVLRSNSTRMNRSQPQRDWHEYEYEYDIYSDGYTNFDEDDEDYEDEFSESGDEQDSVAQVQIQPEAVEHPGPEYMASEPGRVWDMEVENSLDFDIGFSKLDGDMGSIYGLDYAPSPSHIDTAASGWGLGQ